jgi:hypothetical protein
MVPHVPWPFLLGFVPAMALLLGGFMNARRQLTFEVRGDKLVLTRIGLFKSVQTWAREEIAAIRCVREQRQQTGTDQQGHHYTKWVWVVELQIHPAKGRPVVFSGRYGMLARVMEQEWEWLATALRQDLDVSA